jgi:5-methylcytosine-specific restriction protein A
VSDQPLAQSPRVDWQFEEIVLVCDVVVANGWKGLNRRTDDRVVDLSRLLRRASPAEAAASPTFRNPNGVGRKSYDIETARPGYSGGLTKGGRTTKAVAKAFDNDPAGMHELALAIRATIDDPTPLSPQLVDIDEDETFDEGRTFERRHLVRERDPRARRKKIAHARQTLGHVRCEACGFDFETAYGNRGRDYIECHHRNPLSVAGRSTTALADLALLCSNCHRMVHRVKPWLTVEQLAALVEAQAPKPLPSP